MIQKRIKIAHFVVSETNCQHQTSIDQSKLTAFQQIPVEKKPLVRPTHLNLSLQDIFSQSEDISNLPVTSKISGSHINNGTSAEKATAELLSTPEGPLPPETSTSEDLKIHELLSFPSSRAESSSQQMPPSSQQTSQPMLISPKNAELLIPTSVTNIVSSRNGNVTGNF